MRCFRFPALVLFGLLIATRALATDLTIGLATDVTALDPHYHNVTPNNNVAAHIFGFLVSVTRSRSSSRRWPPNGRRWIR
jgi:hypothetical protein